MNQLEYLTKVRGGWRPTPQDKISYLEMCLERDGLSRDSRQQVYREIEGLRKEIEKGNADEPEAERQERDNWDAIHIALGVTAGHGLFPVARAEEISNWAKKKQEAIELTDAPKPDQHGNCHLCGGPCFAPMGECRRDDCDGQHVPEPTRALVDLFKNYSEPPAPEPPGEEDIEALQRIMTGDYSRQDADAANRCLAFLRAACKLKGTAQ